MPSHNIIYVDMDGVIVDFYDQYYRLAQVHDPELFTVLPKHDELDAYWLEDLVPERFEQRAIDLCNHPLLFEQAKPIVGAIEGVLELEAKARAYGFDTYICSAPNASNKKSYADKASWIERYLGSSWVQRLVLTQDKTLCDGLILIDDKPEGYYVLVAYTADPTVPKEIERNLGIAEGIMRYLTTRIEEKRR